MPPSRAAVQTVIAAKGLTESMNSTLLAVKTISLLVVDDHSDQGAILYQEPAASRSMRGNLKNPCHGQLVD